MNNINCLTILIVVFCQIYIGTTATIYFAHGGVKPITYPHMTHLESSEASPSDLAFGEGSQEEARQKLYRQLRQYGVPPDIAQMYVPRSLTVGDLLGSDSNGPQHSSGVDNDDEDDEKEEASAFDFWSITWYIGSFGGLVAFFLVVTCSEWCCLRSRAAATLASATASVSSTNTSSNTSSRCPGSSPTANSGQINCETPPPGYHLFAPPSYDDSLDFNGGQKNFFDVFVVPVHTVKEFKASEEGIEGSLPPKYSET